MGDSPNLSIKQTRVFNHHQSAKAYKNTNPFNALSQKMNHAQFIKQTAMIDNKDDDVFGKKADFGHWQNAGTGTGKLFNYCENESQLLITMKLLLTFFSFL